MRKKLLGLFLILTLVIVGYSWLEKAEAIEAEAIEAEAIEAGRTFPSGDRMMDYTADIVGISEDNPEFGFPSAQTSTTGGRLRSNYMYKKFKEFGLRDVKKEIVTYPNLWRPEKFSLTILAGTSPAPKTDTEIQGVWPGWSCGNTPPEGITADLVYAGFGNPTEMSAVNVRGKIVIFMAKLIQHFTPSYDYNGALKSAEQQGAVGIIAVNASSYGLFSKTATTTLPVIMASRSQGLYLKQMAEAGAKAKIVVKGSNQERQGTNVWGMLPGNGKSREVILIGAHSDGWFSAAHDCAACMAGALEMADYYARLPRDQRDRDMVFISLDGHDTGSNYPHQVWVDAHRDLISRATCFFDFDQIAATGFAEEMGAPGQIGDIYPTGVRERTSIYTTNNVLLAYYIEALAKNRMPACKSNFMGSATSNSGAFYSAGVPFAVLVGSGLMYHTLDDNLEPFIDKNGDSWEKITPEELEQVWQVLRDVIDRVDKSPDGFIREVDINPALRQDSTPPEFTYIAFPNPVYAGDPFIFYLDYYNDMHNSLIMGWTFDFGDGTTPFTDGPVPYGTHIYKDQGTYKLTVTVKGIHQFKSSLSETVTVLPRP